MADWRALSDEMAKLKRQIETVLYISGYQENSDLGGLSDYRQIKSVDDLQKMEEYEGIIMLESKGKGLSGRGSNTKLLFPLFRIIWKNGGCVIWQKREKTVKGEFYKKANIKERMEHIIIHG